jgi:hypothetical protein
MKKKEKFQIDMHANDHHYYHHLYHRHQMKSVCTYILKHISCKDVEYIYVYCQLHPLVWREFNER